MTFRDVVCGWNGEVFVPLRRFEEQCRSELISGDRYIVSVAAQRNIKQHRWYFVTVEEVFKNLPDEIGRQFSSAEALRKFALIKCGYSTIEQRSCPTKAEAERTAAVIRSMDEYSIVEVEGSIINRWTAMSQSVHAMGGQKFAKSVDDVVGYLASLINVSKATLEAEHKHDKIAPALLEGPDDNAPGVASLGSRAGNGSRVEAPSPRHPFRGDGAGGEPGHSPSCTCWKCAARASA